MGILSEIIEYYKTAPQEKSNIIFERFLNLLWKKDDFSYKINNRLIKFNITGDLKNNKELMDLLEPYSIIKFKVCSTATKNENIFNPISYIKIHINTLYGVYCDKNVYYPSKYYKLLCVPRKEYYKILNSGNINIQKTEYIINKSLNEATKIKQESIDKKLDIKWEEFQKYINKKMKIIFDNIKSISEYQTTNDWSVIPSQHWDEDNFFIGYINKCLTGYMLDLKKEKINFRNKYKWKHSLNRYCCLEEVNNFTPLQLCVSKFYKDQKFLIKIADDKNFIKLTKRQKEIVKQIEQILNKYTYKEIIFFNDFRLPCLNETFISNKLNLTQSNLSQLLQQVNNSLKKEDKQGYTYCHNCGVQIIQKSNKTKYCKKCKREMELEKYKRYNKKRNNHR